MNRFKIAIIGGGFVGSTVAHWLLSRDLGDIVLLDLKESLIRGRALDLMQSTPLVNADSLIVGTADYEDIKSANIVIITAGAARQPGMSRDDLQQINAKVVKKACEQIKKYAPNSIVIIVTNPVDVMTYHAWQVLGHPTQRVIGMAGILDSARFRTFIAQKLNVSVQDVQAFVLGGHGDTMVPMPRLCHIGGIPLKELLPETGIKALVDRAKKGGGEIVSLLKSGSAYYTPALSVVEMVESIIKDQNRILPVSTYLNGEYEVKDLFMGVLSRIGKNGVEQIMPLALTEEEQKQFQNSAKAVAQQVKKL